MWKASETKNDKGSCIHSKDVSIQMSLFLYLLNMVTIIRISYPEKSNRVQSRSCHVSLLKLDIVFIKLKNNKFSISLLLSWHWWNWFEFLLETFVICFAKYHCILDLNATCLVCKAFLIHTFSIKINLLVSLQFIEMHKVAYMIMQIFSMLLSLFALSDPVGDYSFAYIMTKRGSSMWWGEMLNCCSNCAYWREYILRGSNPLRGSIAYTYMAWCMMLCLKVLYANACFIFTWSSHIHLLWKCNLIVLKVWYFYKRLKTWSFIFLSLCNVEYPVASILLWGSMWEVVLSRNSQRGRL